jgi:ribosomal protein S18 acetylase RimI-like enzyme
VIRSLDLADAATVRALLALQRAAYAVEAQLLRTREIPALSETAAELAVSGETFLGAERDGRLVGAVSYRLVDDTVDIHRLVVDPACFRQGIAGELLDALPAARRYVVATGAANAPARALYERRGFRLAGAREVAPGLVVVQLERLVPDSATKAREDGRR